MLCYVKFAEDSNDYRKQENFPLKYKEQNTGGPDLNRYLIDFKFCENSSSKIFGGNKLLLRWKDNLDKFAENNLGLIFNRFQVHYIRRTLSSWSVAYFKWVIITECDYWVLCV